MQAYCVKCRAKKEMKSAKAITMKNGKPATQGVCPSCGTKMFKIGAAKQERLKNLMCRGWRLNLQPVFYHKLFLRGSPDKQMPNVPDNLPCFKHTN